MSPASVEIWTVALGVPPQRFNFVSVNLSHMILEVEAVVHRELLVWSLAEKKSNINLSNLNFITNYLILS